MDEPAIADAVGLGVTEGGARCIIDTVTWSVAVFENGAGRVGSCAKGDAPSARQ
jgi:hypothetical protein